MFSFPSKRFLIAESVRLPQPSEKCIQAAKAADLPAMLIFNIQLPIYQVRVYPYSYQSSQACNCGDGFVSVSPYPYIFYPLSYRILATTTLKHSVCTNVHTYTCAHAHRTLHSTPSIVLCRRLSLVHMMASASPSFRTRTCLRTLMQKRFLISLPSGC